MNIGFRGRGLKGDTGATGSTGATGAIGPSHRQAYYWYRDGNYYVIYPDGTEDDDADFDDLFLAILDTDGYKGLHEFGSYRFEYDTELDFQGDGTAYGRHLKLYGTGVGLTTFVPSGVCCLKPHRGIALTLRGITFEMDSEHGIYAYDDGTFGAYDEGGAFRGVWDELEFTGGVSGKYAILIENGEWIRIGDVRILVNSGVRPFKSTMTAGTEYKYGTLEFDGIFTAVFNGNNNVGMEFAGVDSTWRNQLFGGKGHIWLKTNTGADVIGLKLNWVENYNIGEVMCEGQDILFDVQNSWFGRIHGGNQNIMCKDGSTVFKVASSAYGTTIEDFSLAAIGSATVEWANDLNNSLNNRSRYRNITLWGVAPAEFTETVQVNNSFKALNVRGNPVVPGRFPKE